MRVACASTLILFGTALLACGSDEALGSGMAGRAGESCQDAACSPAAVTAVALDEKEARRCVLSSGPALEVLWSKRLIDADGVLLQQAECGALGPCAFEPSELRIAASDDGSLWLAGRPKQLGDRQSDAAGASGVWLAHYAVDGTPLSGELVEFEPVAAGARVTYDMTLAPGGRGTVLLGMYRELTREGDAAPEIQRWVRRYDAAGHPVGQGTALSTQRAGSTTPLLTSAGDDALAVVSGQKLMLLEQWKPRWERPIDPNVEILVGDAPERLWSFTSKSDASGQATLSQYRAGGESNWIRTFPRTVNGVHLATAPSEHVIRSGVPVNDPAQLAIYSDRMLVHKISHDGDSVWCVELKREPRADTQYDPVGSNLVVDSAGTTWIEGPYYTQQASGDDVDGVAPRTGFLLYEIPSDGLSCVAHDMANSAGVHSMAAAARGGIYYVDYDAFGLMR